MNKNFTPIASVTETNPDEAADNVNLSNKTSISADALFQLPELKSQVRTDMEEGQYEEVDGVLVDAAAKSEQHAAVIKDDLKNLNPLVKMWRFTGDTISARSKGREIADKAYEMLIFGENEKNQFELEGLNAELSLISTAEDYGYDFAQTIAPEVVATGTDILEMYADNIGKVAAGTLIPMGVGGIAGSVPGAVIGGVQGFGWTSMLLMGWDTYTQTAGQIYNDLRLMGDLKAEDGRPFAKSQFEKKAISHGIGALSAAVSYIPIVNWVSNKPWAKRMLNPRKFVKYMKSASGNKWKRLAFEMGKQGFAEAGEEGIQEFFQIVATELGQSIKNDSGESDFYEAMLNIKDKWQEYLVRIGKASTIGFAAGGTLTGVGKGVHKVGGKAIVKTADLMAAQIEKRQRQADKRSAAEAEQFRDRQLVDDIIGYHANLPQSVKATKALQLQTALQLDSRIVENSKTKERTESELRTIRERTFKEAGIEFVYVDKEDLNKLITNEEHAEHVLNKIDPSGKTAAAHNAPIRMNTVDFADLVSENPEFADNVKIEPEGYTAAEVKERFKQAEEQRTKILSEFTSEVDEPSEVSTTPPSKEDSKETLPVFKSEEDYLGQPTLSYHIKESLPEKTAEKMSEAYMEARQEIAEEIRDMAEYEMNKIVDVQVELDLSEERLAKAQEIEDDPKIQMVEDFINNHNVDMDNLSENQKHLVKNKRPALSIDPRTIDPALYEAIKDNPNIKKRKVFHKQKGVPGWVAAEAFDVKSANELVMILAEIPTRNEAVDQAAKLREPEAREQAMLEVDMNEPHIKRKYGALALLHRKELKYMLKHHWAKMKKGIEVVALKLPTFDSLKIQARDIILNTPVKALRPNQWKIAERRSTKNAIKAILKNNIRWAFEQKVSAAISALAAGESHAAIMRVNRANKFLAKLRNGTFRAELKEAGVEYEKAVDEILDYFDFYNNGKKGRSIESYRKWVKTMAENGIGNFDIPESMLSLLADKQNAKDLTYEQYMFLVGRMAGVVQQAKMKNQLMRDYHARQENVTEEIIAAAAEHEAQKHIEYDPDKNNSVQFSTNVKDTARFVSQQIDRALGNVNNTQYIVTELDEGKAGGWWSKNILQPLKGIGAHAGVFGQSALNKMRGDILKRFEKAIKIYGAKEFRQMDLQNIYVSEFEGIAALGNGKTTKLGLFMMATHIGNPENINRLENFGISKEVILEVIEKYLTEKEMDMIQDGIWNVFKGLKPRIEALEKMTKGVDGVQFVETESFVMFGKVYEGGYMPLSYRKDANITQMAEQNRKQAQSLSTEGVEYREKQNAYEGIVAAPHLNERTGSDWLVDLSPETIAIGFERVAYDLTMRVPVADTMKLLSNPRVAKAIGSVVGPIKYNQLFNNVAEMTNSAQIEAINLHRGEVEWLDRMFSKISGAAALSWIAFNAPSVAIQLDSMKNVVTKMGVASGGKYITAAASLILNPITDPFVVLQDFFDFAADIDPSILSFMEQVDDHNLNSFQGATPKKFKIRSKHYQDAKRIQHNINEFAFQHILGTVDVSMKIVTVIAAYNQFLNGDAPGHPLSKLEKMTNDERVAAAKGYAAEISSGSLTAATKLDRALIQKMRFGKLFSKFWNDARNTLNTNIQEVRNIRYDAKKAIKKAKEGDFDGAKEHIMDAGLIGIRLMAISMTSMIFQMLARGKNPFAEEEEEEIFTKDTLGDMPEFFNRKLGMEGFKDIVGNAFLSNMPIIRDLQFAMSSKYASGVQVPVMSILSEFAVAIPKAYELLADPDEVGRMDLLEDLSDKELRALLTSGSILLGGLPVNGTMRVVKFINELDDKISVNKEVLEKIQSEELDERAKDIPVKSFDELIKDMEDEKKGKEKTGQEAINQMIEKKILEKKFANADEVPEEVLEIIKQIESGGRWNASPNVEGSSAFGWYQFTKKTWKRIMNDPRAKHLGLTETGRLKEDMKQQTKAMKWLLKDNIKVMKNKGIKNPTIMDIYGAHFIGPVVWAAAKYQAPNKKLKDVLEAQMGERKAQMAIKANKSLLSYTVGTLKSKVKKRMANAIDHLNKQEAKENAKKVQPKPEIKGLKLL